MTTLLKKRDDAYAAVKAFRAEHAEEMTSEQLDQFKGLLDAVEEIDAKIALVDDRNAAVKRLEQLEHKGDDRAADRSAAAPKTLGEHFVKEATAAGALAKAASGAETNFSSTEFEVKAANDPHSITAAGEDFAPFLATFDRNIVNQRREELIVSDLMGSARVTGSSIRYLVEKAQRIAEGAPATVAEGGKKPYVRYNNFDVVLESLTKVAALAKLTDETIEDAPFVADYINQSLIYDLSLTEEGQILNGDGSGSNMTGLLNRSGVQVAEATSQETWFDDLYKAGVLVNRTTPLKFDAYVMNDVDYQVLRLAKDGNGQYYAGGPFQGTYGVGGIMIQPPLWGKRVVVTDEIPVGTALVGAFRQGATILRKGGIRVDAVKTNADDFEHNLVTLRAEERLGLMVPLPSAFVKVTLGGSSEEAGI